MQFFDLLGSGVGGKGWCCRAMVGLLSHPWTRAIYIYIPWLRCTRLIRSFARDVYPTAMLEPRVAMKLFVLFCRT